MSKKCICEGCTVTENQNLLSKVKFELRVLVSRVLDRLRVSNLERHAKDEIRLSKLDEAYDGMISKEVMSLMRVFGRAGHSGGSAMLTLEVFTRLVRWKTLTPLTSNKEEWMEVSKGLFQSRRDPSCFSDNNLKTFYSVDDKKRKKIKLAK